MPKNHRVELKTTFFFEIKELKVAFFYLILLLFLSEAERLKDEIYENYMVKNKKTNLISIKKAQKKQLVTRLFEQIYMFESLE